MIHLMKMRKGTTSDKVNGERRKEGSPWGDGA